MLKYIFALFFLILIAFLVALSWGRYAWQRDTTQRRQPLQISQTGAAQLIDLEKELAAAPAPVQRYLRKVVPPQAMRIQSVQMRHHGEFNMSETAADWQKFSSDQWVNAESVGFDWDAKISYLPGLSVYVHDSYIQRNGSLHASLAGCLTLAHMSDTPEMAHGELMRYYAEAPWYPTALLPSANVSWRAVDEHSALLVARDGTHEIRLQFHFGNDDLVKSILAQSRGRTLQGKTIPTMWEGGWSQYELHDGFLIPAHGEVAWLLDPKDSTKRQRYWSGQLEAIRYAKS
jgi:hypothetical protein